MRWKRKKLSTPKAETFRERSQKLGSAEVEEALDQLITNLGVYFAGYRRSKAYDIMCEIQATAEAAYVLAETILERHENPLGVPEPETKIKPTRQVSSF